MTKRRQKVGKNINRVVQTDKDCMKAFHDCNALKREHLNEFITDNRIQKLEWDKIIEHIEEPGTKEFIWVRGERYDDFVKQYGMEHLIEHKAKGSVDQSGNRYHDLAMADYYCFNLTQVERDTVRTEDQQREDLREYASILINSDTEEERDRGDSLLEDIASRSISVCDMAYTSSSGIEVGFEVTTKYYTAEMVQAKQSYCEYAGLQFSAFQV